MTQAFNLSQFANKVNTSGQADLTTAVTGTLPQANGGTGVTTASNGELLIGNGSGFTKSTVTAGSGISVTNGSGSITIAASGGGSIQTEIFTAPGTWTKPASCSQVRVTVVGGGGGGTTTSPPNGTPGGTSSFGSIASATGGTAAPGGPGIGTVSVGTALRSGSLATTSSQNPSVGSIGVLVGQIGGIPGTVPVPGTAYSVSGNFLAGSGGGRGVATNLTGGFGGVAIAIAPVSSPQSVTIGAGGAGAPGNPPTGPAFGGIGGAVVVEYIG